MKQFLLLSLLISVGLFAAGNKIQEAVLVRFYTAFITNMAWGPDVGRADEILLQEDNRNTFKFGTGGALFSGQGLNEALADETGIAVSENNRYNLEYTFQRIEKFSGLKVFKRKEGRNYSVLSQKNKLSSYNPALIEWAGKNLIPKPKTKLGREITFAEVYNKVFKRMFRAYADAYVVLQQRKGGLKKEASMFKRAMGSANFDGLIYLNARYWDVLPHYTDNAEYPITLDGPKACGFWLRRQLGGTADVSIRVLAKVLKQYDSFAYGDLSKVLPK